MQVEWNPSVHTRNKIYKVLELRKEGKSLRQIAKIFGHHWTYIAGLLRWHKENEGGQK